MKKLFYILLIVIPVTAQGIIQYELTDINFEGNEQLSDDELRSVIISKESPGWLSDIINTLTGFGGENVYFDSSIVSSDIRALNDYYYANGFFKAKFSASYDLNDEHETAILTYSIKENDPAFFRSLTFNGLENITSQLVEEINELQDIDTTMKYSAQEVSERRDRVLRQGLDFGYMLIEADDPVVNVDTLQNFVDVVVDFNIGERYEISEVRVQKSGPGANLVEENLIKNISGVDAGKFYSFYDLQRAQVRLYRTNMFSSVIASGVVADTAGSQVPVNISTDIGLMHELSPEIIVNDEDQALNLGVGLSFSKMNFLGGARRLTVSTSTASQSITEFIANPTLSDTTIYGYADARVILDQPYLFGRSISTRFENYFTLQKRRDEYNATLYGTQLNFDVELSKYVYLTSLVIGLSWENSEYVFSQGYMYDKLFTGMKNNNPAIPDSIVSDSVNSVIQDIGDFTSQTTNSVISVNLGANKTDNLLFPTEGYSLFLTFEDGNSLSALASEISRSDFDNPRYFKFLFNGSVYFPVYESVQNSFGMKFKTGFIHAYKGDKFSIPLNQKFYSGGSNSNRGWRTRELVPEQNKFELSENPDPQEIEAVLVRNIIPGGFFILEGSLETRNRIAGQFGSAFFIDYGNVWNHYSDVQWNNIAVAAGFGLRFYSDFAPFRIDFGFKVYDPQDRRSFFKKSILPETLEFHFGIGEAF